MSDNRPTQKQADILQWIASSIKENGYPPTLRELGAHFGIRSTNGVHDHLWALEKKGYLWSEPKKARAMGLTREGSILCAAARMRVAR